VLGLFKKKQSPEEALASLRDLGFSVNSETALSSVVEEVSGAKGSRISLFEIALAAMGDEQYHLESDEMLPWLSDDVWHFDYEAIEDKGSYVSIVKNCARLARGDLQVSELRDHIDTEGEFARVSFRLDGKKFVYNLRLNNDWADPLLFSLLNSNLKGRGCDKRFFQHDLGQDCLIVCKSQTEVDKINGAAGLRFAESKG
jgi:hypothetical protein